MQLCCNLNIAQDMHRTFQTIIITTTTAEFCFDGRILNYAKKVISTIETTVAKGLGNN